MSLALRRLAGPAALRRKDQRAAAPIEHKQLAAPVGWISAE
jgi:hypothetical protein